ncbi:imidazolonepropionase [Candidatus Nitrospira bockiana]
MDEVGLIRRGAVLIRNGIIEAVGSAASLTKTGAARRARRIDAGGRVVLPGFVDSHTHALFAGSRVDEYVARIAGATYEEIARAGGGIQASAARTRSATMPELVEQLSGVVRRFLEYGTTTLEVKSGYGLDVAQELKLLEAVRRASARCHAELVPTLLLHDVPARFKTARAAYLVAVTRRLIPTVSTRRLAEFCDVFCDRGYFSLAEARAILSAAARAGLKLKIHAEQLSHSGAARLAARLKTVSADHLEHIQQADLTAMKRHGTIATLLPGSVFHLGETRYPPARRIIDAGIPVAVATNFNPGSAPSLNLQMTMALACSQMRMSPAEAVTAATINGAHAINRGRQVGSIEIGKQGDLVVMEVSDYREIPYFFGMNHCAVVIKRGRVVCSREGVI